MATKVITELVDDLDGSPAEVTISFALDNVRYEIDLSRANGAVLRHLLEPYTRAGRALNPGKKSRSTGSDELTVMREWLRERGQSVSDRGRIPAKLQELYRAAH